MIDYLFLDSISKIDFAKTFFLIFYMMHNHSKKMRVCFSEILDHIYLAGTHF